jgi:hypothetical protein
MHLGILNRRVWSLAGLLVAAGCQVAQPQSPDRVNPTPIAEDQAMSARSWPRSEAVYPNFSSTTGPSEVILVPREKVNPIAHAVVETPLFVADLLLMPIAMVQNPPWTQVEGTSLYLPPTYTGGPPLDPTRPDDLSGGPGTGYNAAPGRAK